MTTADYDWYYRSLAGEKLAIRASAPQCGYFRRRFQKDGPWVAVAIWRGEDGELLCRAGQEMSDPRLHWLYVAKHPIPEAACRHYLEHGQWPGEEGEPPAPGPTPEAFTSDGQSRSNEPAASDDVLFEEAAQAIKFAEPWLQGKKIETEQDAQIVSNKVGTIRSLKSRAEKAHKTEKEPHLTAGRKVDERYKPTIKALEAAGDTLRRLAADWLSAQQARHEEAVENGEDEPPFEGKLESATGRTLSLRVVADCEVTDHAKALRHFKDHPDIKELVHQLAKAEILAGNKVPGAKRIERSIAA